MLVLYNLKSLMNVRLCSASSNYINDGQIDVESYARSYTSQHCERFDRGA